jgi:putative phosphoesterase
VRLGLLSDAHGNADGVRLCLDVLRAEEVDQILFLGDLVGYLPDALAAHELLADAKAFCLLGNHDAMFTGALPLPADRDAVYRLGQLQATPARAPLIAALAGRQPVHRFEADGVSILCCHAGPQQPLTEYVYPDSALTEFAEVDADVVFLGHTHRPFDRRSGDCRIVNVGSCGLPRDAGSLACCAVYDTVADDCRIIRLPFDAESLIARWAERVHPQAVACLRRPVPADLVGDIRSTDAS